MSSHSHHSRKHRRRNAIQVFFDRLRGRDSYHHHRSSFPGIHLPENYNEGSWKKKEEEISSSAPAISSPEGQGNDFSGNLPEKSEQVGGRTSIPHYQKRKKSIFSSFDRYFKERELRREERMKAKLRRKHRKESEREFRKLNAGPGLGKKLFSWSEEMSEAEKEKHVPLFSQRSPLYRNMTITINSMLIFLITYILVYLFYWLTCMLVASYYGLDSSLFYYDLRFNNHSPFWNRFNILLVTGIPPFASLFLGIFLYRVLFKNARFAGLQKLFILWSAFHLFNHFFGAFPSGVVTDEGFGYVAAWMYMNTAFKFMFSLVSLFILMVIGYYSAKHILETSDSLHRIKANNRLPFMLYQMAIPWLTGTIILLLVRIPHNFDYPYETLMLFSTAFLVIPAFFNEKVKPELNLLRAKKRRTINLGYVAMILVFFVFYRIMLGIGLHFVIEINVSISPATV
jgi:hypothetical protein